MQLGHSGVKPNHFFRFPSIWVFNGTWAQMSNSAKAAFNVLGAHANWETGECFLTISTIAKEAGYERRSIFYAISELEGLGAIIVKRKLGEVNHYIVVHYQTGIPPSFVPEEADMSAQEGVEENIPEDCESLLKQNGDGCSLEGKNELSAEDKLQEEQEQEDAQHLESLFTIDNEDVSKDKSVKQPLEPKPKDNISLSNEQENQQKGQPQREQIEQKDVSQEQSASACGQQTPQDKKDEKCEQANANTEEGRQKEEVIHKIEKKASLIIAGVQVDAHTNATQCTTPCIELHPPVQQDAPKQKQENGNNNFQYNNTQPPVDKWYRELNPKEQTDVLCCTRMINKVVKSTFGQTIPPVFIMEKMMKGFEPQFIIKMVKNCNAPMVLNPIGWFRNIQPWWHVKGESDKEYWRRLADFGMQPLFRHDFNENNDENSASTQEIMEETEEIESITSEQLSPRAEQTIRLMNQYNSLIADAKVVYALAKEENATEDEKVQLMCQYNDMMEKGKKILDRIEEFGYLYKQEEMENRFVMDNVTEKLKDWID